MKGSPITFHLPYTTAELRQKVRTHKAFIPGMQPKLSAQFKTKDKQFEIVETRGRYIVKLPSELYPELPENEALTMSLAATIGIEVPVHGLLYTKDKSKAYFIKRFDRIGHTQKIMVEDFAQLSHQLREAKYQGSMEKVASLLLQFTSFPKVEALKLLKLTLFNFLVGNEDMHLKRFALMTHKQIVTLSPAYGLLNSTIVLKKQQTEIALPLNNKKNHLNQGDFFDYFGKKILQLNEPTIAACIKTIQKAIPGWQAMIQSSFLTPPMKGHYSRLIRERAHRLRQCP